MILQPVTHPYIRRATQQNMIQCAGGIIALGIGQVDHTELEAKLPGSLNLGAQLQCMESSGLRVTHRGYREHLAAGVLIADKGLQPGVAAVPEGLHIQVRSGFISMKIYVDVRRKKTYIQTR